LERIAKYPDKKVVLFAATAIREIKQSAQTALNNYKNK